MTISAETATTEPYKLREVLLDAGAAESFRRTYGYAAMFALLHDELDVAGRTLTSR